MFETLNSVLKKLFIKYPLNFDLDNNMYFFHSETGIYYNNSVTLFDVCFQPNKAYRIGYSNYSHLNAYEWRGTLEYIENLERISGTGLKI